MPDPQPTTDVVDDGSFAHATCECGWRGPARRSRRTAREDAAEHSLTHAELAGDA